MVDQSRLPVPSPKQFFSLVQVIGTGELADRLKAAETLAKLSLPCDEIPVLLALIDGQAGAVQVFIVRAIGNAIRKDRQPGIETARLAAVSGLLQRLPHYEGQAARAAGAVVGELSGCNAQLDTNTHDLVEGLVAAGVATAAIPAGDGINALVLAAPRSRQARAKLRDRPDKDIAGVQHPVVSRVRQLIVPINGPNLDEVQHVFGLLEGLNFGSHAANAEVAGLIRDVLRSHGIRLCCTICKQSANLVFVVQKSRKQRDHGLFKFDHGRNPPPEHPSRYHGGTASIPRLKAKNV